MRGNELGRHHADRGQNGCFQREPMSLEAAPQQQTLVNFHEYGVPILILVVQVCGDATKSKKLFFPNGGQPETSDKGADTTQAHFQ